MTQRRRRMGLVHAVAWATCLAMPLPGQAQEGKLRQPASPPTATVLNPVPKDLKVKAPAGEPPACAPGEPSPKCRQLAQQAHDLLAEIAHDCPACVPQGRIDPSTYAGKPLRPREFCQAVEAVALLNGLKVKCLAN